MSAPDSSPDPSPDPPLQAGYLPPAAERLAILALASGAFVMALNSNVMAALLPYMDQLPGVNKGNSGALVASAGIAGAVGAFLLGPLVDKFGRRPPMVWGMLLFTLASLWHMLATTYDTLFWARAVSGFASGVVYSSASAAVADLVPYERRGKAMGVFTAGMFLGLPVGLPLAGVFAGMGHWEYVYGLQALIGAVSIYATWRYLPAGLGKGSAFLKNLPRLASVEVLGAMMSVLFYVGSFFTAVQFAGLWLDEQAIVSKERQWSVWLVLGLCSAFGSLFLARFGDRIGKRNWTNLTCVLVSAFLFALSFVDGLALLILFGVPLAVVSAARTGPFQALISELVPSDVRGTLMGVRSAVVNLGVGLFPLVAAGIASDSYQTTLYLSASGVFGAMLWVILFVRKQ